MCLFCLIGHLTQNTFSFCLSYFFFFPLANILILDNIYIDDYVSQACSPDPTALTPSRQGIVFFLFHHTDLDFPS